jgi:hypothetical protein
MPLGLIGAVNQNRHESNAGSRRCRLQAFHETFAVTAVCGWGCGKNAKRQLLALPGTTAWNFTEGSKVPACE